MTSQKVLKLQRKLKKIIVKSLKKNNVEKALAAINASAHVHYHYNQQYFDEELEQSLQNIEKDLPEPTLTQKMVKHNTILFYDGFGLDIRGLALIYLKALAELNYNIIYITIDSAKEKQPEIKKLLNENNCTMDYIPWHGKYVDKINQLVQLFEKYSPEKAFFYTTPWDVSAVIAFEHFDQIITRYQINLTDHAFWLGKYVFDICIEFREYGASISNHYRKIKEDKIHILPYYPYVDYQLPFQGFPFEDKGKKVIFSGGNLYKTYDEQGTYYKLVYQILKKYEDVIFLYAGKGDTKGIDWLKKEYPERVFFIKERKDLYQIMQHSYLYLNTFPMIGGLMMQYAAIASCIPLTLKRENSKDGDGILLNEELLGITFTEAEELLSEIDRLMKNPEYYQEKKKLVAKNVIREQKFKVTLERILSSKYSTAGTKYLKIDTTAFLADYAYRISIKDCEMAILKKNNKILISDFPGLYFSKKFKEITHAGNQVHVPTPW